MTRLPAAPSDWPPAMRMRALAESCGSAPPETQLIIEINAGKLPIYVTIWVMTEHFLPHQATAGAWGMGPRGFGECQGGMS